MLNISLPEFILCGSILLIALLLTEILDWTQLFSWGESENYPSGFDYGYAERNGPQTWKELYPESAGLNQSPINVITKQVVVLQPCDPLRWNGYHLEPLSMTMVNDGNTVAVHSFWGHDMKPCIEGGPLSNAYDFYSFLFHWGPSDHEGSEHALDYVQYPLELQVIHVKRGFKTPFDAMVFGEKEGLVIVSFFFQITNADNPLLDSVVTNLRSVARPGSKIHVPPFPLEWIFPQFENCFYTYHGSLSQPPCSEIVTWIIYPEPISISSAQMNEFRKVYSLDGPLRSNCRPIQNLNDRDVYYYE